ncbi:uncharacterized protein LOC105185907 [Harpegnathos saltator]|uniref:uncharacterized protein LOC105185907 n=1 Tax=Harpegnathos saltator TaxID=610380 RepID=UPI000DBEDC39|nr:uncharacterized protein LOC105185907 [Harpegnathos saltator]
MAKTCGVRNVDERQRKAIVEGRKQGRTHRELAQQCGISKSAVTKLLKRLKVQEGSINKKTRGRPRCTTSLVDRNILRTSRSNPHLTAPDIAKEILTPGQSNPSVRTIRRRLQDAGLHGRRPVKKSFISAKNRKARVEWSKAHLNWTSRQWSDVLWSDESKFMLFGSDGIKWVRRPEGKRFDPKYQLPTMKHGGGSVIVWGAFSAKGMGPLHKIDGIMDQTVYINILQNVMLPYAKRFLGRGFIFQQDNDPKHRAVKVQEWFRRHRVILMDWPNQSPDLNIIESLWEELERRLAGKRATNAAQKFSQLEEEWKKIPQATIDALIDSMPRRCQAVIDAKGFATKY